MNFEGDTIQPITELKAKVNAIWAFIKEEILAWILQPNHNIKYISILGQLKKIHCFKRPCGAFSSCLQMELKTVLCSQEDMGLKTSQQLDSSSLRNNSLNKNPCLLKRACSLYSMSTIPDNSPSCHWGRTDNTMVTDSCPSTWSDVIIKKPVAQGFPGGAVVENLPANAGDTGSSPGLGRSHMPRGN